MRKIKKWIEEKISIRTYFILIIMIVLVGIEISAKSVSAFLYYIFHIPMEFAEYVWGFIVSIVLGCVVTAVLSRRILAPITRLGEAMSKVAQGDFSVHLETNGFSLNEVRGLYDNFNTMVKELGATEMLQSDFVSNVSHEIKTPINAIEGYTMLLQENCALSGEQTEYAEKILYNTKRLSGLVRNILLLSKIDNQTIQVRKEPFQLAEQIRQAIVYLEPKWSEKEIEFDADLEERQFTGNEQLLLHVWLNLIDNAIKFSPVGGSIFIRLKSSEQNVLVSVQDQGCGIPEGGQRHLFDKFYQADSSHKDEGNGLGLALVKQVVAFHNGHIDVENCPEGGCKFSVILPVLSGKQGE